jgi:hypothetical protein
MTPARSKLARSKLMGVLAVIALIGLSAIGIRLSEPDEKFQVITGDFGELVKINNGEVSVTHVRVGSPEGSDLIGRPHRRNVRGGYRDRSGHRSRTAELGSARLLSGQVHYDSYQIAGGGTPAPVSGIRGYVFEVVPPRLTTSPWSGPTRSSRVISNGYGSSSVLPRPTPSNGAQRPEIAESRSRVTTRAIRETPASPTHSLCRRGVRGVLIYLIWWATYAGIPSASAIPSARQVCR